MPLRPFASFAAAGVLFGTLVLLPLEGEARAQTTDGSGVTVHELDAHTGLSVQPPSTRLDYLNVGPIVSLVGGYAHATGVGLEASWIGYPEGRLPSLGYGAFLQAQLYDEKYLRTSAGAQAAAGPAGVELGLGFRQTDGTYASTLSGHVAVFLSLGFLYIAVRFSPALVAFPSDEPSFGFETAFTFALKLPIAVNGRDPSGFAVQADRRSQ
jgi:hypothetical protein